MSIRIVARGPSRLLAAAVSAVTIAATVAVAGLSGTAAAADPLISQGKPATASSTENAGTPASAAVDGNTGTRWSSAFSDPQWIQVDLGASANVTQVVLNWEAAFARSFQIQTAPAATGPFTTIFSTTAGAGGIQTIPVTGSGRFVRMNGTVRATQFGYSLWEFQVFGTFGAATCGTTNAALNHPASASSIENAGTPASAAFDGNTGTRWSSAFSDPQWLQVDLGAHATITQVVLDWETAYATAFQLQVSENGSTWTNIYSTTTGTGGTQTLNVTGAGRYVRMNGTARATGYGYSLWEFQVFGSFDTGGGCGTAGFVAPKYTYPVASGSCSGITIIRDVLYVACERGTRLYREVISGSSLTNVQQFFNGTYGRLRTVEPAPDGGMWMTTTNTGDKDSTPNNSNEKILHVDLG